MKKGNYLYDVEVIIVNPEGSGSSFTICHSYNGRIFGPQNIEPGITVTRTVKIDQELIIINNRSPIKQTIKQKKGD